MNKLDLSNMSITPASTLTILLALVLAFAFGVLIYYVYKINYRGVLFNNNFGLTLALMTMVTVPVVMCIRDSIQLSMGMVGALSIVRFRTAVKDPLDIAYMFWSLTTGILLGASQFFLATLAFVVVAVMIFVLGKLTQKSSDCYLLVVRLKPGADGAVLVALKGVKHQKMRSKTASRSGIEMTLEVRAEKPDTLLTRLLAVDGVEDATLVAFQADTL